MQHEQEPDRERHRISRRMAVIEDAMTDADEVLRGLYQEGDEDARMVLPQNFVEWDRTCELLRRWLPNAPATILDVGGASGRYAQWLSSLGYSVLVIDLLTKHVEQARAKGINAEPGDARELPQATGSVDAVLLMGPLYHLPLAEDRQRALAEATRVCRSGGQVIAAAMSRWAKPAVRASRGELADAEIQRHLEAVLKRTTSWPGMSKGYGRVPRAKARRAERLAQMIAPRAIRRRRPPGQPDAGRGSQADPSAPGPRPCLVLAGRRCRAGAERLLGCRRS